jgi:hypothetical protein
MPSYLVVVNFRLLATPNISANYLFLLEKWIDQPGFSDKPRFRFQTMVGLSHSNQPTEPL